MDLEKINLDIEMDFTNLKISFKKILRDFFLLDFFHLKCYGISMCGGKSYKLSFQLH
jgi:hypothetical protein